MLRQPSVPFARKVFQMKPNRPHSLGTPAVARHFAAIALSLACGLGLAAEAPQAAATTPAAAKTTPAKRAVFSSPQEGFDALVAVLRQHDAQGLARLLGPGHERVSDSGDSVADRAAADHFVAEYDAKHGIQMDGDTRAFVVTGATDWPMPIPLVKRGNGWSFDADAGEEEIIARRIGRNELDVMQVCLAFVDMEREYAEVDRDGNGILEYASRLISSPGKHDGLYWPAAAGEAQSPAGARFADADPRRSRTNTSPRPFHGYYYRILTRQGAHAAGGARNYYVNGKLIGGVALVAWPASYLASGVKTFVCNLDGAVFEKDLGPGTPGKVAKITAYDPDPSWAAVK